MVNNVIENADNARQLSNKFHISNKNIKNENFLNEILQKIEIEAKKGNNIVNVGFSSAASFDWLIGELSKKGFYCNTSFPGAPFTVFW